MHRHGSETRLIACLVFLLVALLVPLPAVAQNPTAGASPVFQEGSALDIAAMALTPTDVEAAGLDGYGVGNAVMATSPEVAAEFLLHYRGDAQGATASGLQTAAPDRIYVLNLVRPGRAGEAQSGTAARVVSYVLQFADQEAAEVGFQALAASWISGEMDEMSTTSVAGEQRLLVAGQGREEPPNGSVYDRLDLLFRTGQLVAGVSHEDYLAVPEQAAVEALADSEAARIEEVIAGHAPGLSGRILRLEVPGANSITDHYSIVGGVPVRRYDETTEEFGQRRNAPAETGMVDQYLIEQQVLGTLGTSQPPLAYYPVGLTRFLDEGAAAEFIDSAPDRLAGGGREDLSEVEAPELGDQSAAFTYRHTRGDGVAFDDYRVYARVGSEVFSMAFNTTEELDPAAIDALAAIQVACLEGATCLEPAPIPSTLIAEP
jgi:hypothetical protein